MIPKDPVILLSYVNTKLRDSYPDFEALCEDMSVSEKEIREKLTAIGYIYDRERNQFV